MDAEPITIIDPAAARLLLTRNELLSKCSTRYIAFVGSDQSQRVFEAGAEAHRRWSELSVAMGAVAVERRDRNNFEQRFGSSFREHGAPGCIVWRTEALMSIGGFDLRFDCDPGGWWFAEIDAQRRLARAGWFVSAVGNPEAPALNPPQFVEGAALLAAKQMGWFALPWLVAGLDAELVRPTALRDYARALSGIWKWATSERTPRSGR
jgi:hypothetical protein